MSTSRRRARSKDLIGGIEAGMQLIFQVFAGSDWG